MKTHPAAFPSGIITVKQDAVGTHSQNPKHKLISMKYCTLLPPCFKDCYRSPGMYLVIVLQPPVSAWPQYLCPSLPSSKSLQGENCHPGLGYSSVPAKHVMNSQWQGMTPICKIMNLPPRDFLLRTGQPSMAAWVLPSLRTGLS